MNISDVLAPDAVIAALKVNGKKQLLQELAARAAQLTGIPERKIFESLNERERLGSTGVGQGIAIPHSRVADLKGIVGVFARLESPIDYNAVDKQPVDLVFMLLAPEGAGADHLRVAVLEEDGAERDRRERAEQQRQRQHARAFSTAIEIAPGDERLVPIKERSHARVLAHPLSWGVRAILPCVVLAIGRHTRGGE